LVGRTWRHRGWANSGNRDEPAPGSSGRTERGSPRITARKSGVVRTKRKMVEAIVPARKREPRFGCPHVEVVQLQKSLGGVWPRISSANALQKERQGRVNGGLARSERRWVKPSTGEASERYVAVRPVSRNGERSGPRPRVARECHSAVGASPKAVSRSWDRGCNGHRILRRVPADRRHPGSVRGAGFHESAKAMV